MKTNKRSSGWRRRPGRPQLTRDLREAAGSVKDTRGQPSCGDRVRALRAVAARGATSGLAAWLGPFCAPPAAVPAGVPACVPSGTCTSRGTGRFCRALLHVASWPARGPLLAALPRADAAPARRRLRPAAVTAESRTSSLLPHRLPRAAAWLQVARRPAAGGSGTQDAHSGARGAERPWRQAHGD